MFNQTQWPAFAAAVALATATGSPTLAQVPRSPAPPSAELEFRLAGDVLATSSIQLIHGQQIDVKANYWQTIVVTPIMMTTGVVRPVEERCTGTLVGPVVILLAAHCLDQHAPDGTLKAAYLVVGFERVQLKCQLQPEYLQPPDAGGAAPRRSEDVALCHAQLTQPHPNLDQMKFENIDVHPVKRGDAVLMMGYGCTDIKTPSVMNSTLAVGNAEIGYPPGGGGAMANYATIAATAFTGPALCPGDSGGPLMSGATQQNQDVPRQVRGVNSTFQQIATGYLSQIAMLSSPGFEPWAKQWLTQFPGAYICGISDSKVTTSCRI